MCYNGGMWTSESRKQWRDANSGKYKEMMRLAQRKHRGTLTKSEMDEMNKKREDRLDKTPKFTREYRREYNRTPIRTKWRKEYNKKYVARLRMEAMNRCGGPECKCCGESNVEVLAIDHIDQNGGSWRRKMKIGSGT